MMGKNQQVPNDPERNTAWNSSLEMIKMNLIVEELELYCVERYYPYLIIYHIISYFFVLSRKNFKINQKFSRVKEILIS